jgi:four helix bundle protein
VGDVTDLEVYTKAMSLGQRVYDDVSLWAPFDRWTLGNQLVRASDSIAANIAEAYGRHTSRERRRFLHIARGSARETECLLVKASQRSLPGANGQVTSCDEARGISMMLSRLIASIR